MTAAVLALLLLAAPARAEQPAWQEGKALIKRGERRADKAEKLADFRRAEKDLEAAATANPGDALAHFWHGMSLGRLGETQGIMKSLFLIKPIRREMQETIRLDPKHGGAHRVLGEILWQVPGFAGGDKKKALEEFEAAVRLNPEHTSNYAPLAKAYIHFGRKDEAVALLRRVEAIKDPADPEEYSGDLADARRLLAKLAR